MGLKAFQQFWIHNNSQLSGQVAVFDGEFKFSSLKIDESQMIVRPCISRIDLYGFFKRRHGFFRPPLLAMEAADIEIASGVIRFDLDRFRIG